jgi:CHAT domain/NB-ARC domain
MDAVPETTLTIRHVPGGPPRFQVVRQAQGNVIDPVEVPSPVGFPVNGVPDLRLGEGLRWYLEDFLRFPFAPEVEQAGKVVNALKGWGEAAFQALFGGRVAGGWFDAAAANGSDALRLQIAGDDPAVLAWPWEALHDPRTGWLAPLYRIERRLDHVGDPLPLPGALPRDRLNVLLVIARPTDSPRIRYRAVSRALADFTAAPGSPVTLHVLRPPTFLRLREHLEQHPDTYHLLHFDGHGTYQEGAGSLEFETNEGRKDAIDAARLGELLREYQVPAVVLNACRSAMQGEQALDPFASVAAALVRAGVREVVAMAYLLYVGGAKQFLPAFYRGLFRAGSFSQAVRLGRREMRQVRSRSAADPGLFLEDWLVPVLYRHHDPLRLDFEAKNVPAAPRESRLPPEARETDPYGFIGRDDKVLDLERALLRKQPGVLLMGLSGVGKTALVRDLLDWLEKTSGLGEGVHWFSFGNGLTAAGMLDRLGTDLFGEAFQGLGPPAKKLEELVRVCRDKKLLLVWDRLRTRGGLGELVPADAPLLGQFLTRLRGGQTRVLLTCSTAHRALDKASRFVVRLGGLDKEECWELADTILYEARGKKRDPADKDLTDLVRMLNGHPQALQVVLRRLEAEAMRPADLVERLRAGFDRLELDEMDEVESGLLIGFGSLVGGLSERVRPLLIPLSLHEGFVSRVRLAEIARRAPPGWTPEETNAFVQALEQAGFLHESESENGLLEIHPLLVGYLRSQADRLADAPLRQGLTRAFVEVTQEHAQAVARSEAGPRADAFGRHEATFQQALIDGTRLRLDGAATSLMQLLAQQAYERGRYQRAATIYAQLADYCRSLGDRDARG